MNELILKAKNGDKEAFTTIILEIEDDLYKIARMRLKDDEQILDCIQETLISAFKTIKKLRDVNCFPQWIIKILINKCNDEYRRRKRAEISFEDYKDENALADYKVVDFNETLDFEFMTKFLDYKERIVLILYYLKGYTTKEIGEILQTNENTIKTRLFRAKEKIRNKYEKEQEEYV